MTTENFAKTEHQEGSRSLLWVINAVFFIVLGIGLLLTWPTRGVFDTEGRYPIIEWLAHQILRIIPLGYLIIGGFLFSRRSKAITAGILWSILASTSVFLLFVYLFKVSKHGFEPWDVLYGPVLIGGPVWVHSLIAIPLLFITRDLSNKN